MLAQFRQQSIEVWNRQTPVQRVVLIALVVSALILIPLLVNWATTPSYSVAYSGLSESDASQIVGKLDELQIPYQLQGSGTILVPQDQVYTVRLRMAREGLPQVGSVGFEIFTTNNTLGLTEFTQQVYYQQALEGELERTIGGLNAVKAVRVHIVTPEQSLTAQDQAPTTASITIEERPGTRLDVTQVSAITHLVASSVEGLKPENVVVVDVRGNMLASGEATGQAAASAQSDSQRAAESSASSEISRNVQDLLDTALGPNRSVVQTAVTMDWTQREVQTQAFDPASVVRSSQFVTENYTTTNGTISGIPGAATNLPPTTSSSGSGNETLNYTRTEKTLNYEITQSNTKEVLAPGKIERISLSVLVDGITDTVQLASLQSAIAAAAGIDTRRGDVLSVQTLDFDRTYYETQASDMDTSQRYDLYWRIGEVALAILVLVGLLWYIQRLLNRLRLTSAQTWTPVFKPVAEMALPPSAGMAPGMVPGMAPGMAPGLPGMAPAPMPGIGYPGAVPGIIPGVMPGAAPGVMPGLAMPPQPEPMPVILPEPKIDIPAMSAEDEQMQKILQRMAEESPASIAEIIQLWLSEDEK